MSWPGGSACGPPSSPWPTWAALYFHHDWARAAPDKPFDARQHVLKDRATQLELAHEKLAPLVTAPLLAEITADVPPDWFGARGPRPTKIS